MAGITFNCSNCGVEIEADDSFAGSVAQCPNCNSTVMIPMQGIKPGMKIAGYEISADSALAAWVKYGLPTRRRWSEKSL